MFRRGLFRIVLLGLLTVGVLSLVGRWSYSAGWTRGYFDSRAVPAEAAPAEDAPRATAPQPAPVPGPYGYYYGPHYSPFGWFFGGLLKFFFFLFLASALFRLFFGWRWHRHKYAGPWGKRPFSPHHGPHGSHPREKQPGDVEPDIRTL